MRFATSLFGLLFAACPGLAFAQKDGAPPPKPWWLTNSFKAKEQGDWLFHVEGEGKVNRLLGNQDARGGEGRARAFLRNGQLTQKAFTQRTDQRLVIKTPTGDSFTHKVDIRQHGYKATYDLSDALYGQAGIVSDHNTRTKVNRRDMYFAGAGYYLIETAAHTLKLDASYAYAWQDVLIIEDQPLATREENRKDYYIYAGLEYTWIIAEGLMATQGGEYWYNLREKDDKRWGALTRLDAQVAPYVTIGLQAVVQFNNSPQPDVQKRDVTTDVNLTFSY